MSARIDMVGRRRGMLRVLALSPATPAAGRHAHWRCLCDCGQVTIVDGCNLRNGHTTSCGCQQGRRSVVHGCARREHRTPEFSVWAGMLSRCRNPHNKAYANYGGRGISVCERWHDFANFLADMGQRPSSAHSIERRNNDGGYSPDNCEWATRDVQAKNKRPPKRRDLCLHGHALTGDNVYHRKDGKRGCRTCRRRNMANYYARVGAAA